MRKVEIQDLGHHSPPYSNQVMSCLESPTPKTTCSGLLLSNHSILPQVRSNERVSSKHGPSLSVGQVGCGLPIDGQDEITDTKTSITANRPAVDYTPDQHSQTIFHGAHCHPFEVDYNKYLRTHLNNSLDLLHSRALADDLKLNSLIKEQNLNSNQETNYIINKMRQNFHWQLQP